MPKLISYDTRSERRGAGVRFGVFGGSCRGFPSYLEQKELPSLVPPEGVLGPPEDPYRTPFPSLVDIRYLGNPNHRLDQLARRPEYSLAVSGVVQASWTPSNASSEMVAVLSSRHPHKPLSSAI